MEKTNEVKIQYNPNTGERWYYDKEQDKIINLCYFNNNTCMTASNMWCEFCDRHYCGNHDLLHECYEKYGLTKIYIIRDSIEGNDSGYCLNFGAAHEEKKRLEKMWSNNTDYYYIDERYARSR